MKALSEFELIDAVPVDMLFVVRAIGGLSGNRLLTHAAMVAFLEQYAGADGEPGTPGEPGDPGDPGKSAYELALEAGFDGPVLDWLASLQGADGKTLLHGTVAPSNGTGADGDFYLNTDTQVLFGPRNGGTWPMGVSIKGDKGKSMLNGALSPGPGVGEDGDIYLDTAASVMYGPKAGGAWPAGVSIKGIQGNPGTNGTDGREVQLQKSATHVQWRYAGVAGWTDLVPLTDIKGNTGSAALNVFSQALTTLNYDTAKSITVASGAAGLVSIYDPVNGKIFQAMFHATATPSITPIPPGDGTTLDPFYVTTGVLTGTTGGGAYAGRFGVSVTNGKIYLQNRAANPPYIVSLSVPGTLD